MCHYDNLLLTNLSKHCRDKSVYHYLILSLIRYQWRVIVITWERIIPPTLWWVGPSRSVMREHVGSPPRVAPRLGRSDSLWSTLLSASTTSSQSLTINTIHNPNHNHNQIKDPSSSINQLTNHSIDWSLTKWQMHKLSDQSIKLSKRSMRNMSSAESSVLLALGLLQLTLSRCSASRSPTDFSRCTGTVGVKTADVILSRIRSNCSLQPVNHFVT